MPNSTPRRLLIRLISRKFQQLSSILRSDPTGGLWSNSMLFLSSLQGGKMFQVCFHRTCGSHSGRYNCILEPISNRRVVYLRLKHWDSNLIGLGRREGANFISSNRPPSSTHILENFERSVIIYYFSVTLIYKISSINFIFYALIIFIPWERISTRNWTEISGLSFDKIILNI